jgi:hypothetical protein
MSGASLAYYAITAFMTSGLLGQQIICSYRGGWPLGATCSTVYGVVVVSLCIVAVHKNTQWWRDSKGSAYGCTWFTGGMRLDFGVQMISAPFG